MTQNHVSDPKSENLKKDQNNSLLFKEHQLEMSRSEQFFVSLLCTSHVMIFYFILFFNKPFRAVSPWGHNNICLPHNLKVYPHFVLKYIIWTHYTVTKHMTICLRLPKVFRRVCLSYCLIRSGVFSLGQMCRNTATRLLSQPEELWLLNSFFIFGFTV